VFSLLEANASGFIHSVDQVLNSESGYTAHILAVKGTTQDDRHGNQEEGGHVRLRIYCVSKRLLRMTIQFPIFNSGRVPNLTNVASMK